MDKLPGEENLEVTEQHRALASHLIEDIRVLGGMCIDFGKVDRFVHVDKEGKWESDTDHTFMLSMVCCSIASGYIRELDVGKVAQFALIHDFVEVIVEDTETIFMSGELKKVKDEKEAAGFEEIKATFGIVFPWIHQTIEDYERLDTPEARFVKVIDKIMPSITHLEDGGMSLQERGVTDIPSLVNSVNSRTRFMDYAYDQPLAIAIREEFIRVIKREIFEDVS